MDITKFQFYKDIASLQFVEEIWLFGSRARGDNQERADIDLAVLCTKATFQDWDNLLKIIENADTLLKIDCVRLDELDEESDIKKAIRKQGKLLYAKL